MSTGQGGATGLGHDRLVSGILGSYEPQLLEYLAKRLPLWVLPDQLTLLGVLGSALAAVALTASHLSIHFLWVALFGLLLNWAGDSLDGTLARVRHIERPRYGFFVDHATDIASQFLIVVGLGLSPFMRLDVALLALVGYLGLSTYTYVKLHVTRVMQITYFGVGPTEVRALIGAGLVLAALVELSALETPFGVFGLFDLVAVALFLVAMASGAAMFVRDARQLALIDPVRRAVPDEVRMIDISGNDSRRAISKQA